MFHCAVAAFFRWSSMEPSLEAQIEQLGVVPHTNYLSVPIPLSPLSRRTFNVNLDDAYAPFLSPPTRHPKPPYREPH